MHHHIEIHGVEVPRIGLGTWEVTGTACYEAVRHALEAGYGHVDTAQMYGNEQQVGRALADSGVDRDEVFVTTKITPQRARPDDVRTSTHGSLDALGLDHVDLLLIHWPSDVAPMEDTLAAMAELRDAGATRLIGVSNYTSSQLDRAARAAEIATDQVEYHPFLGQDAVLQMVRKHGLFLTAYSPLTNGDAVDDATLARIGEEHGKSAAQVALRWLFEQDDVVLIPRSRSPEHITANLDILDFELTEDQRRAIDDLPKDRRKIDPPFAPDWD